MVAFTYDDFNFLTSGDFVFIVLMEDDKRLLVTFECILEILNVFYMVDVKF